MRPAVSPDRAVSTTGPLDPRQAWRGVGACVVRSAVLLARHQLRLPREHVGRVVWFADGTSARIFRETVVSDAVPRDPCLLAVSFRLRLVRGIGHRLFQWESILNTPLFAGFPGFVSKLWLADDERDCYRGLYEWDGADSAERYARSLWRVLAIVSEPSSIAYQVIPSVNGGELLQARSAADDESAPTGWWRVVGVTPPTSRPATGVEDV